MQKLLQKLYYGSVDELDGVVRRTAEYKKALHKLNRFSKNGQ